MDYGTKDNEISKKITAIDKSIEIYVKLKI